MSTIDLWYATRATGIAALVLLTATTYLGVLTAGRAQSSLPAFARAEVHRRVSFLTVVFLLIHVLTSVVDTYVNIGWLAIVVPFVSTYHRWWLGLGTVGIDLLGAVVVSSLLRQRISARSWRLVHWFAYLSWPVAVAHGLGMGTDSGLSWVLGLVALCIASIVGVTTWRIVNGARVRARLPRTAIPPRASIRSGPDAATTSARTAASPPASRATSTAARS